MSEVIKPASVPTTPPQNIDTHPPVTSTPPLPSPLPPVATVPPVAVEWMKPPTGTTTTPPPPPPTDAPATPPTPPATPANTTPPAEPPAWAKALLEEVSALKKERADKEAAAKKQKEAEALAAAKAAGKEGEYLEEQRKRIEAERKSLEEERITNAILSAGREAGIRHPDYLRQVDRTKIAFDDSRMVVGADKAVSALKETHPELFGEPITSQGSGKPPLSGGNPSGTPQGKEPLSETEKRIARNFGWEVHGMRFRGDPRQGDVLFEDVFRGPVKAFSVSEEKR